MWSSGTVHTSRQFVCYEQGFRSLHCQVTVNSTHTTHADHAGLQTADADLDSPQTNTVELSSAVCAPALVVRPQLSRIIHSRRTASATNKLIFTARRYASAGTSYGPVSVSVTSRCSIESVERVNLVLGFKASFDQSYTVF